MPSRDFYETLGVSRDASADQIKKAYRSAARKHHPDVNPGDKASETKFKEIQNAYDVLGNEEKKRQYDQVGHSAFENMGSGTHPGAAEWAARGGPGGFGNVDLSDLLGGAEEGDLGSLFGNIFGGGGRPGARGARRGPRKGQDTEASLAVPFATAVLGGETSIQVTSETGSPETLVVKIPPGSDEGTKLRLRGRGEKGDEGTPRGNLTITLSVQPHPHFERDGDNLKLELPISVSEAVLGAKVDVPTLAGATVGLPIPSGSSSGRKLRLRGRGVPAHGGRPDGDLFVQIKIVVPKTIDDEGARLIREFAEKCPVEARDGLW